MMADHPTVIRDAPNRRTLVGERVYTDLWLRAHGLVVTSSGAIEREQKVLLKRRRLNWVARLRRRLVQWRQKRSRPFSQVWRECGGEKLEADYSRNPESER